METYDTLAVTFNTTAESGEIPNKLVEAIKSSFTELGVVASEQGAPNEETPQVEGNSLGAAAVIELDKPVSLQEVKMVSRVLEKALNHVSSGQDFNKVSLTVTPSLKDHRFNIGVQVNPIDNSLTHS